jgi:hypothetical protein
MGSTSPRFSPEDHRGRALDSRPGARPAAFARYGAVRKSRARDDWTVPGTWGALDAAIAPAGREGSSPRFSFSEKERVSASLKPRLPGPWPGDAPTMARFENRSP